MAQFIALLFCLLFAGKTLLKEQKRSVFPQITETSCQAEIQHLENHGRFTTGLSSTYGTGS